MCFSVLLGDGFKHFLMFTPNLGDSWSNLTVRIFFQTGWFKNHQLGVHFSSHHRSGKWGPGRSTHSKKKNVRWSSNSRIKSGEKKTSAKKKNKRSGWPPEKLKSTSNIPPFPGGFFFLGGGVLLRRHRKRKRSLRRSARRDRWEVDLMILVGVRSVVN